MFKVTNRNHDRSILLLPGWATDYRIFEKLDIPYNYILPVPFNPNTFENEFLEFVKQNGIKMVSLLGWSLGGYCAADFAVKHPEMIEDLILVSVKKKYDKDGINIVKGHIKESRKAYLYKFYYECFSKEEAETLKWFKDTLMKEYLDRFDEGQLFEGLDYLLNTPLDIAGLKKLKAKLIYGMKDKIVPLNGIIDLKKELPLGEFQFVEEAGHLPFTSDCFSRLREI